MSSKLFSGTEATAANLQDSHGIGETLNYSPQRRSARSDQHVTDGWFGAGLVQSLDAVVSSELGGNRLSSGTETILFVEDEAFVREVTSEVLKSVGYKVSTAKNGVEALQVFHQRSEEPDLLLSDIVLPGKSGYALASELRKLSPKIRILFISGYGDQWARDEYEKEDTHFLAKPFSMPALLREVRQALDGSKNASRVAMSSSKLAVMGSL